MAIDPLPVYTPPILDDGGGVFGGIRRRINELGDLVSLFGDRMYPGRAPSTPTVNFPYIVFSHVSSTIDDYMGAMYSSLPLPLDFWYDTIQISIYADNYAAARWCARAVHTRFSRHYIVADCVPVFFYPISRMILLDPNKSERGGDIWHVDHRYSLWSVEWIFTDPYEADPRGVFNNINNPAVYEEGVTPEG